jgi:intracellular sulfur oxidation DsrE/DsrF family protein
MPNKTGNAVHDANVLAAELAFQNATVVAYGATLSAATVKAADIARLQAIVNSGLANGVSVENQRTALRSLQSSGAA